MRIAEFVPSRNAFDPKTKCLRQKFVTDFSGGPEDYDIFYMDGNVYVCRDGCAAIFMSHGTVYLTPEKAKDVCERYAIKWPRPEKK